MKKILSNIYTLAALLMAGAAFSACSSSEDAIEQPQQPATGKYTMIIKASKGNNATTRALKLSGSTLNAYWSGEETIEVYQNGEKIGTASAAPSNDGNTTVTATLESAPISSIDLNFYLGGKDPVYTGQNGLLTGTGSISEKYDYVESLIYSNAYTVEGYNVIPGEYTTLNFTDGITHQAVIKFTLKDKGNSDAAISPSALTITDGTSAVELTNIPASTYTANGAGVLYVAFPAAGSANITLTATVGSDTYTYTTPSAKTFVNGKYYEITVKMTKLAPLASSATAGDIGKLIGSDGRIYSTQAAATAANTTAVAMIAYVGEDTYDDNYKKGLAITLADESSTMNWSTAKTTCEGKTAVTGAKWCLPSEYQWYQMLGANGGEQGKWSGLNTTITSAGGTGLQSGQGYWTSSEAYSGTAYYLYIMGDVNSTATILSDTENYNKRVRACLVF